MAFIDTWVPVGEQYMQHLTAQDYVVLVMLSTKAHKIAMSLPCIVKVNKCFGMTGKGQQCSNKACKYVGGVPVCGNPHKITIDVLPLSAYMKHSVFQKEPEPGQQNQDVAQNLEILWEPFPFLWARAGEPQQTRIHYPSQMLLEPSFC